MRVSTGRVITMLVPVDMTERERLDLNAYIAAALPDELAKAESPRPRVWVPGRA